MKKSESTKLLISMTFAIDESCTNSKTEQHVNSLQLKAARYRFSKHFEFYVLY